MQTPGEPPCKVKPYCRGNFYCADHGGNHPLAVKAARRRYLMWALAGEPLLHPELFEVFMVLWTKKLMDQVAGMGVSKQLRLLEIGASLLEGLDDEAPV